MTDDDDKGSAFAAWHDALRRGNVADGEAAQARIIGGGDCDGPGDDPGLRLAHEQGRPPFVSARRSAGSLAILCPFCRRVHWHGAGQKPGDGDGQRLSHCSNGKPGQYVLVEVGPDMLPVLGKRGSL